VHSISLSAAFPGATPVWPAEADASALSADVAAARALFRGLDEAAAAATARAVLEVAVGSFWTVLCPTSRPREPFWTDARVPLTDDLAAIPGRVGTLAAGLSIEVACDVLGRLYSALLPQRLRARQGSFYTPPALAALLVQRATEAGVDWRTCRALDPACGGGAILLPVLWRLLAARAEDDPEAFLAQVSDRLHGVDLDPAAGWLAQVMIDAALLPWTRRTGLQPPRVIQIADSLAPGPTAAFDLIVGNPPYGAIRLSGAQRERFARSVHGRANLFGLFLDYALDLVRPGGVIAQLTPTSWLGGQYFKSLRGLLAREAAPLTVDFVVEREAVFNGAVQETVLSTWRKSASPAPFKVSEVRAHGEQLEVLPLGAGRLPIDPSAPWPLPRRTEHALVAPALHRAPDQLTDWGFRVRTGPVDACRNRDRITAAPGMDHVPLIWAEAVQPGGLDWPIARRRRATWFDPAGKEQLLIRKPVLLLQRTTAPEQPRRLVAALLPAALFQAHGAVAVENHVNIVEPIAEKPPVSLDTLAAFLGSEAADTAFRCISGTVAVSAYELLALPLPSVSELGPLSRMVADGAGTEQIGAECRRLYQI
jgi:adenine-specific DNA-methyltransferase